MAGDMPQPQWMSYLTAGKLLKRRQSFEIDWWEKENNIWFSLLCISDHRLSFLSWHLRGVLEWRNLYLILLYCIILSNRIPLWDLSDASKVVCRIGRIRSGNVLKRMIWFSTMLKSGTKFRFFCFFGVFVNDWKNLPYYYCDEKGLEKMLDQKSIQSHRYSPQSRFTPYVGILCMGNPH